MNSLPFRYSADHPVAALIGALDSEVLANGSVRPHRLPAHLRGRLPSQFMQLMVDTTAGIRLRFQTKATRLEVVGDFRVVSIIGVPGYPAAMDLLVDGEIFESRPIGGGQETIDGAADLILQGPSLVESIAFDGLDARNKVIEVWFPTATTVDFYGLRANAPLRPSLSAKGRWIHHGSSISHCLEVSRPTFAWPISAAKSLGYELVDLGFAGSAVLDPFVARAIRDQPAADLISLEIGINLVNSDLMRMRVFTPALEGFIDTIRDGHPEATVVVISPIICPAVEAYPGPTALGPDGVMYSTFYHSAHSNTGSSVPDDALTLQRIRRAEQKIADRRRNSGDRTHYLDGLSLLGQEDFDEGLLPDGLHPNDAGYQRIAERFVRRVKSHKTQDCEA